MTNLLKNFYILQQKFSSLFQLDFTFNFFKIREKTHEELIILYYY